MDNVKICGTGHRPQRLSSEFGFNYKSPGWTRVIEELRDYIVENKVTHVISGMALGFDMALAIAAIQLKNIGYNIHLEAAVPCRNQSKFWNEYSKRIHAKILERCDEVTILAEEYSRECMMNRNTYMIDKADVVLALWDGKCFGGTYDAVRKAQALNKTVVVVK